MIEIKQAFSEEFLKALVRSTINGIEKRDCYYDQFHYVNRHFINTKIDFISGVVTNKLRSIHPNISSNDIIYINDFVAPVNLVDAQIHTNQKNNKYGWHIDGIDKSIGPCYNLWIPLFQRSDKRYLDDASFLNVIDPKSVPGLYDDEEIPKSDYLIDPHQLSDTQKMLICRFLNVTEKELIKNIVIPSRNGKLYLFPCDNIQMESVISPDLGDAYIFNSYQYHSSGESDIERIGISIKFLIGNSNLGFRKRNVDIHGRLPPFANWESMFITSYNQFGDFTSYNKYIDFLILNEQYALGANQNKLNCVCDKLEKIYKEISVKGKTPDVVVK